MAYHLDGQSLFKPDINIEKVKAAQVSSLDSPHRNAILAKFPNADTVNMFCKVQLFGTEYAPNMIVMSGQGFGQPEFYKLLSIVVCSDKVSFLSKDLLPGTLSNIGPLKLKTVTMLNLLFLMLMN